MTARRRTRNARPARPLEPLSVGSGRDKIAAQEYIGAGGNETWWMLSDHLGSVRNITNSGNTVRWQYRYDTYGGFENGTKLLTIDNATFNDPDSGFTPRTINGGVLTTNSMTTPRRFRYLFTGQSWTPTRAYTTTKPGGMIKGPEVPERRSDRVCCRRYKFICILCK